MVCPSCGQPAASSDPRCLTCGRLLVPAATDAPAAHVVEVAPPAQPSPPSLLAADPAGPAASPDPTADGAPPAPAIASAPPIPGYAAPPTVPLYGLPPYGPYPPPGYAPPPGFPPPYVPPPGYAAPPYAPSPWAAPYWPSPYGPPPSQRAAPPRRGRPALIVIGLALLVAILSASGFAISSAAAGYGAGMFGPAATPTPTPNGESVLNDPLASNIYGWAVAPPYCQFANGGYQISGRICFAPTPPICNGSVSVKARQIVGPLSRGLGIVLRYSGERNYDAFDISIDGFWTFVKVVNGIVTQIIAWRSTSAVARGLGATNILLVQFGDSHFDFFVNGFKVGQADDPTFTRGYIGLESFQDGQVVFNDLTIVNYP